MVEVSYIEGNDSYRFIRAKAGWRGRGEGEEEKEGAVVEKDETVRNVARSTLPFPRLNIAIQLFDPVLRLPSGGNLLLPPPLPPPSSSEEESRFVIRDCRSEQSSKNSADILQRFSFFYIM